MTKIRLKFTREESVKFISHLDLMKAFERAIRRANLPIKYSKGFNPHQAIVFGLPLGVGVTSESEYADLEFEEVISIEKIKNALNVTLPLGVSIIDISIDNTKNNIMSIITNATYKLEVSGNDNNKDLEEKFNVLLNKDNIFVIKEGKNGSKNIDIKPMIQKVKILEENNKIYLDLQISAGSRANLKPQLLISAYNDCFEDNVIIEKTHRTGLYIMNLDKLYSPLDDCILLAT